MFAVTVLVLLRVLVSAPIAVNECIVTICKSETRFGEGEVVVESGRAAVDRDAGSGGGRVSADRQSAGTGDGGELVSGIGVEGLNESVVCPILKIPSGIVSVTELLVEPICNTARFLRDRALQLPDAVVGIINIIPCAASLAGSLTPRVVCIGMRVKTGVGAVFKDR